MLLWGSPLQKLPILFGYKASSPLVVWRGMGRFRSLRAALRRILKDCSARSPESLSEACATGLFVSISGSRPMAPAAIAAAATPLNVPRNVRRQPMALDHSISREALGEVIGQRSGARRISGNGQC